MCGIIASASHGNVASDLIAGLRRLEYRGYDSAGISTVRGDGFETSKEVGRVEQLVAALPAGLSSRMGIAHTRWATQGAVSRVNAHPHNCGPVSLVHNGIVENFDELAREHLTPATPYRSETDSELLAILVRRGLDRGLSLDDAVRATFDRLEGQNSIAVLAFGRDGPEIAALSKKAMVMGRDPDGGRYFVSSDAYSLEPLCPETGVLEPGTLLVMTPEGIRVSEPARPRRFAGDGDFRAASEPAVREPHVHEREPAGGAAPGRHMREEILSQPAMARRILDELLRDPAEENGDRRTLKRILDATDEITSIACGSSFYASLVGKYWFQRMAHIRFAPEIASEYVFNPAILGENAALLSISQSGETADTLVAMRRTNRRTDGQANGQGYRHFLTLVNTPDSSMTREADCAVMMQAGREVSVAATKTFTAELLHLFHMAHSAKARRAPSAAIGIPGGGDDLLAELRKLPDLLERVIEADDAIRRVAEEIAESRNMLFLARGILLSIALEGALKMKEVSYIHAEAYAGGELKHGSLALVDPDIPVIALASTGSIIGKIRANIREIRVRGGRVFLFCDEELFRDREVPTVILPKTHYLLTPMVTAVAVQLLAYHVATLRGMDPDRPRNLAKSVTVE